jgi:hypothetical protein
MAIQNLQQFRDYCFRTLGEPIVEVNVTDEQFTDRYEDALRKFQDHHFDGVQKTFFKHQITETDFNNKYIPLPANIVAVNRIVKGITNASGGGDASLFSVQYQFLLNQMHLLWSAGNIAYFEHTMQQITMMDQILNGQPTFRYNKVIDRLYIDVDWNKTLTQGRWIVLECDAALDPSEYTKMFENVWLKRYTTALVKKQWGENLKKFSGVQMIGGVSLNGQQIWNEAVQEVLQLEEELRNTWELPIDAVYMG